MKGSRLCGVFVALAALAPVSKAALLVNAGFEQTNNGYSQTQTPLGWTNVGHIEGVISYSTFGTPAYEGNYFYDFGGVGQPQPNSGDGIEQTVVTSVGVQYALVFGLTNENINSNVMFSGPETLNVLINGVVVASYPMVYNSLYGAAKAPFVTQTLTFTADSTSSTILFTVTGTNLGDQDPIIDGVSFKVTHEPGTWFGGACGLGLMVWFRRSWVNRPQQN